MTTKILIIAASGRVDSEVTKLLEKNKEKIKIIYGTSNPETNEKWKKEGKNYIILDLNKPKLFEDEIKGIQSFC